MDVELLSRMVRELLLANDTVGLPGFGSFVAEDVPACFSDKGFTINPPYRRVSFFARESEDGKLAALYAGSNGLEPDAADSILRSFFAELSSLLKERKSIDLPGLGRLRATRENYFFFVPDEDLDVCPDACGLSSVSLKSHGSVSLPDAPLASAPAEPEPAGAHTAPPASEPETLDTSVTQRFPVPSSLDAAEPVEAPAAAESTGVSQPASNEARTPSSGAPESAPPVQRKRRARMHPALRWALGTAAAAALLLFAFVALSRIASAFTDKLLYTQEELYIINYPEDGLGLPR